MDYKIKELIENADINSLNMLKEKISAGKFNIMEDIDKRIQHIENMHAKSCPVCGNDINSESTSNYTIVFGPESFRRKASFCALDCLSYFVSNIKKENKMNNIETETKDSDDITSKIFN